MKAFRIHPRIVYSLLGVASGLLAVVVAYPLRSVLSGQVYVPMFTHSVAFIDQPCWFALITGLFSCPVIILLAFSLFLFRHASRYLQHDSGKFHKAIRELWLSWLFSALTAVVCLVWAPKFRELESGILYAGKRHSAIQAADQPWHFWTALSIEMAGTILVGFLALGFLIAGPIAFREALKPSKEDRPSNTNVV
jgi:hypothetical protein